MNIPKSDYSQVSERLSVETILVAGRLEPINRPGWALAAFDRIQDPDFELQIIGEGTLGGQLLSEAAERGLTSKVEFTGWINRHKLLNRMHAASILVHPAKFEMGGNVILEGLASGCGVVASDTMGATTIINDGETGQLFHSARQDELAEKLSNLVEGGEYRRLGRNAQRMVEERHSMERVSDRYLDLAQRLTR